MLYTEKLLQSGQEEPARFCCDPGLNDGVCTYKMCNLLSFSMPSFPEVNKQNLGKQSLFFTLKNFLDLSQYDPDAVSNTINSRGFSRTPPNHPFNTPVAFLPL